MGSRLKWSIWLFFLCHTKISESTRYHMYSSILFFAFGKQLNAIFWQRPQKQAYCPLLVWNACVNVIQKYENNNKTTIITQVMCTKCLCKYFLCVLESAKLTINDNPLNIMHLRHFFCWSFWSLLTLAYCYRINIFSCQLFVS